MKNQNIVFTAPRVAELIEREVGENPEADIAMAVDFLREKIARHSL